MRDAIYIVLAISLVGLLGGYVKKYREDRDKITRWEIIGIGFALAGLICLIATRIVENF